MKIRSPTIPFDSTVVVIGANGYIGVETCAKFLEAGFRVRGTVRDVQKHEKWMHALFDANYPDKFELVCVKDFTADGAFDEAFNNAAAVAYVSTPVVFSPDPNSIDVIVQGTLNTLEAAAKIPSIRRYVLVGSSKAVESTKYGGTPHELTVDTFNHTDLEKSHKPTDDTSFARVLSIYCAGRTAAELAFWHFVRREDCPFEANCVVPDGNFGRVLDASLGKGTSIGMLKQALAGEWEGVLPELAYIIDVQDTARLIVAAAALPSVQSERVFAYHENATWNELRQEIRRLYPARPDLVGGEDLDIEGRDMSSARHPILRAKQILTELGQDGFTSKEIMLREFVESVWPTADT